MVFGRGVRLLSTRTSRQAQSLSNRTHAAALITLVAGTSYLVLWPSESNSKPRQFSDVSILSSSLVPVNSKASFNPNEAPVHRIMKTTLPRRSSDANEEGGHHPFSIYSYYVKEPSLQIERPYTPLDSSSIGKAHLTFLVKRYKDGEMSRFLHRLGAGTSLPLRGPVLTWSLNEDSVPEEIVMLVAGTGISIATQLLSTLRSANLKKLPKITVLYAAQTLDSLQCVPELGRYQAEFPELRVGIWVENIFSRKGYVSDRDSEPISAELYPVHKYRWWCSHPAKQYSLELANGSSMALTLGRMQSVDLQNWVPKTGNQLFLVCGPDGFVREMAGEKGRDQVSQGPLNGILGGLGYNQSQVKKL